MGEGGGGGAITGDRFELPLIFYILEGFCFANIICMLPRDKKTA